MREIKYLVLHCTATPQNTTIESILNYWRRELGWKNPGYHFVIRPNGEVVELLPIEKIANGVAGYNSNSIHISYIGGIDAKGRGLDNRTEAQKASQIRLLKQFKAMFPKAEIKGHRDFPKVRKECPSFDVKTWLKTINFVFLIALMLGMASCRSRKQTIQQDIQKTEQNAQVHTDLKLQTDEATRTLRQNESSSSSLTNVKLYNWTGTISPDGVVSGKADSAEIASKSNDSAKTRTDSVGNKSTKFQASRDSTGKQQASDKSTTKVKEPPEYPAWYWYLVLPIAGYLLWMLIKFIKNVIKPL